MKRFLVVLFFPTDVLAHQAVVTTTDYESGSLSSTARACPSAPLLHPCVPNRPTAQPPNRRFFLPIRYVLRIPRPIIRRNRTLCLSLSLD